MDISAVGVVAAELMESLADEYDGDEVQVGTVAVVVELDLPADEGEELGSTEIRYRCTDGRRWIQAGLFDQARRTVFPDG